MSHKAKYDNYLYVVWQKASKAEPNSYSNKRPQMTQKESAAERDRAFARVNNEAPKPGSPADMAARFLYWRERQGQS